MLNNEFFNFDFVPLGSIVTAMFVTLAGISGGMFLLFFGGGHRSLIQKPSDDWLQCIHRIKKMVTWQTLSMSR
ncbi:MAG: hypothetical protein WDN75_20625 [Bacteroidota bacterium]